MALLFESWILLIVVFLIGLGIAWLIWAQK